MALADPDLPPGVVLPELSSVAPSGLEADRYRRLREAFYSLPRRSRVVVVLRLPSPDREPLTLRAAARLFGIGPERVRQLEQHAVWMLVLAWRPHGSPSDLGRDERMTLMARVVGAAINRHPLDGHSVEGW